MVQTDIAGHMTHVFTLAFTRETREHTQKKHTDGLFTMGGTQPQKQSASLEKIKRN